MSTKHCVEIGCEHIGFARAAELKRHVDEVHGPRLMCPYCSWKGTKRKARHYDHIKKHHSTIPGQSLPASDDHSLTKTLSLINIIKDLPIGSFNIPESSSTQNRNKQSSDKYDQSSTEWATASNGSDSTEHATTYQVTTVGIDSIRNGHSVPYEREGQMSLDEPSRNLQSSMRLKTRLFSDEGQMCSGAVQPTEISGVNEPQSTTPRVSYVFRATTPPNIDEWLSTLKRRPPEAPSKQAGSKEGISKSGTPVSSEWPTLSSTDEALTDNGEETLELANIFTTNYRQNEQIARSSIMQRRSRSSSVASDNESIFSMTSNSTCQSSNYDAMGAIEEFRTILLQDAELRPAFTIAKDSIDIQTLKTELHRMLKNYSKDLLKEAHAPMKKGAIYFVRKFRRRIAYQVGDQLYDDVLGLSSSQSRAPLSHYVSGDEIDSSEDEDEEDDDEGEFQRMKDFLLNGLAFTTFKIQLVLFLSSLPQRSVNQEQMLLAEEVVDKIDVMKEMPEVARSDDHCATEQVLDAESTETVDECGKHAELLPSSLEFCAANNRLWIPNKISWLLCLLYSAFLKYQRPSRETGQRRIEWQCVSGLFSSATQILIMTRIVEHFYTAISMMEIPTSSMSWKDM